MRIFHISNAIILTAGIWSNIGVASQFLRHVENNELPHHDYPELEHVVRVSSNQLLDICQGSCYSNDHCKDDLRCYFRGDTEPVLGCSGVGEPGMNYCYRPRHESTTSTLTLLEPRVEPATPQNDQSVTTPTISVTLPELPTGSFRLRLFWHEEYFWQETFRETFWCMHYTGDGQETAIRTCRSSSTKFEIVYLPGEGDMIKVDDRDRCLERTGIRKVTYEDCDSSNPRQRWMGNWLGRRFDMRPSGQGQGCLSQHHHPKSGEIVYVVDCEVAHHTDTGYWERF